MSDLQCAARLFVARHGEAVYESVLITDDGGSLSAIGRQQARDLAERLRGERIARVWSSSLSRAVQTAEIVAAALGVDVVVREGLREYAVGSLAGTDGDEALILGPVFEAWIAGDNTAEIAGGESIKGIVERVGAVLEEIRDIHRGETVLVVSHGGAMGVGLPSILGVPRSNGHDFMVPGGEHVVIVGDADGWSLA